MTPTKIPWITEEDIWRGLPKTDRIPTGGWRGYGAVPSHSYPAPSVLPDGYWQGLGACASTHHPDSQAAKTTMPTSATSMSGFGAVSATQTAATLRLQAAAARDAGNINLANALDAQAKEAEATAASNESEQAFANMLTAITQAGAGAYVATIQADVTRDIIKSGGVLPGTATRATYVPPPTGGAMKLMPLLLLGAVGVGVFVLWREEDP